MQMFYAIHPRQGLAIQLQDHGIVAADDRKRRRLHPLERLCCQIGPVIPFSTGVHLIRVTKREYAGQMPLDHKVQTTIRKKLEGELAEREYKRIVRELRARAVIQYVRNTP